MATLSGTTIANTFDSILHVEDNTAGLVATSSDSRVIQDGVGANSALALATDSVRITSTNKLYFNDVGGEYISGNGSILSIVGGAEIDLTATAIDINGTVDISGTLALNDDVTIVQGKKIIFDSADTYIYANTDNPEDLVIGSDADIILEPDGNVGIGETAPSVPLHIVAADTDTVNSASAGHIMLTDDGGTDYWKMRLSTTDAGFLHFDYNSGGTFYTSMSLNRGGNVGIGITAPTQPFHVSTNNSAGWAAYFYNDGNNADRNGIAIQSGEDSSSGTNYYVHCRDGDAGDVGYLKDVGGLFSAADSSDIRLKENITDTTIKGIETVNNIKVRDFDWKKSGNHLVGGLVANELEKVYPQAVDGEPDAVYEDGKIKPMTVSRDVLVPLLIKAIQELSAKVEALENA